MPQYFYCAFLYSTLLCAQILLLTPHAEQQGYTKAEVGAIKRFRSIVEPELYKAYMRTDEYLIRWIRDQNFDLKRAETKLLKSLQWRKENKIDRLLAEDYSDLEKACPYYIGGRDKIGRPVGVYEIGTCPIRKIVLAGNSERIVRGITQFFERLGALMRQLFVNNLTSTHDSEDMFSKLFCLRISGVTHITYIFRTYEAYYPQYIHGMIAINAPRIFERLLNIVQPLMSDDLRSRLRVYGHNKAEWSDDILKLVSPDQLEMRFGGNRRDRHKA